MPRFSCEFGILDTAGFRRSGRNLRIASQIKREIALILDSFSASEGLGMVTLTDIKLNGDRSVARIFFTVFKVSSNGKDVANSLNEKVGFFRSFLAKRLFIRQVPRLLFVYDYSFEASRKLFKLIDSVVL